MLFTYILPLKKAIPDVGSILPVIILNAVVLPAPLIPNRPKHWKLKVFIIFISIFYSFSFGIVWVSYKWQCTWAQRCVSILGTGKGWKVVNYTLYQRIKNLFHFITSFWLNLRIEYWSFCFVSRFFLVLSSAIILNLCN